MLHRSNLCNANTLYELHFACFVHKSNKAFWSEIPPIVVQYIQLVSVGVLGLSDLL